MHIVMFIWTEHW